MLVWAAASSYTIALVAFSIDLAKLADDRTRSRGGKAVGIAMSTTMLGVLLHAASIVLRGIAAGRVPWANMYEFTLVGSFVAVAVFLVTQVRREVRFLGAIITGLAVLALGIALSVFYIAADGVQDRKSVV